MKAVGDGSKPPAGRPGAAALFLLAVGALGSAQARSVLIHAPHPPSLQAASAPTPADRAQADRVAVASVLDASAAAWSRGDLQGFMACYEDGPDTTYLKSDGLVRGYAAIADMYARRFANGAGGLGRLSTRLTEVRPLGRDYALAVGAYSLVRPASAEASGVFTLVFHRGRRGWRIVSDHTS